MIVKVFLRVFFWNLWCLLPGCPLGNIGSWQKWMDEEQIDRGKLHDGWPCWLNTFIPQVNACSWLWLSITSVQHAPMKPSDFHKRGDVTRCLCPQLYHLKIYVFLNRKKNCKSTLYILTRDLDFELIASLRWAKFTWEKQDWRIGCPSLSQETKAGPNSLERIG